MVKPKAPRDMLGREELTPVPAARDILIPFLKLREPEAETIPIADALGRVTAGDIEAPEDLPPCDRAIMDGYAVLSRDTYGASQSAPAYLNVTGEILMGEVPDIHLSSGNCIKIPTGGILPAGADAVMMYEHTVPVDEQMIEIVKDVGSGGNVIRKGDDIRSGDLAIEAFTRLRSQDLGLLAGLGIAEISVFKKIKVGILSTGDEIIEHTQPLEPGKTRNINSITISASVRQLGALVHDYGIVSDHEKTFFSAVEQAVSETDIVLFSGGSSVGMRDLGEQAIARLGDPGVLVHGVALKPGKPVIIGYCRQTPIFGLPGHPVSAAVCFELFVKPAIHQLSGCKDQELALRATISAILMRNINSAAGRRDIVRVRLTPANDTWQAFPVLGKSGAISSLSRAHGYFIIDEDTQGLQEGQVIEAYVYQ